MRVDEERNLVLTKHTKVRGTVKVIKSDQNPIYLVADLPWDVKVKKPRKEIFNLRNVECQAKYSEYANKSDFLTNCLIDRDVISGSKLWLKNMKFIIHENSRKIRLNWKNKNELKIQELFEARKKLIQNNQKMTEIDEQIAEQIFQKNRSLIIEQVSEMRDASNNLSRIKMWKVKQKVCPRYDVDLPVAKVDSLGNLISNQDELKSLYVDTYRYRLRHRDMKPNFAYLKDLKNNLFEERVKLSKLRKSGCWDEDSLMKVLKSLKTKKTMDPVGLINELFKPPVAGRDVINSLLILSNKVRDEIEIPEFLELTDISSIYKNKGSKNDLNNDREI